MDYDYHCGIIINQYERANYMADDEKELEVAEAPAEAAPEEVKE